MVINGLGVIMRLYTKDFYKLGLCAKGSRIKCAQHGINWSDFVFNGIDSEDLLRVFPNDYIINKVIQKKQEEQYGKQLITDNRV